jgi:CubicO group peptidase (beta-lactamase class C family)
MRYQMRVKEVLIATVVAVAVFACGRSQAAKRVETQPSDVSAAVDSVVEQRMRDGGMVGLGAAIIVNKKIVWMKGYGFADKERAIAFTPDTVMNIASISKTFTGAALMRAVQDGKVSLDEDINSYLPFKVINPHFPKERITLRQLATHTSGITDRPEVYEATYHFGGAAPEALGEFLQSYFTLEGNHYSKENFLKSKPGSHREYSNIGAGLAGYIVELAVDEKLNTYTKRHIFEPLGMSNSGWFLSEIPPANHTKLYVAQGLRIPIPLYEGTTYPDGGVRTSVSDLAKFFVALLNEGAYKGTRILEKPWALEMLRFQYTSENKPENVNIQGEDSVNSGIFWATKFDATRIGHNGSDPGVRTMMLADPSREVGVILFTNTSAHDEESEPYFNIFDALWAQAVKLRSERGLVAER